MRLDALRIHILRVLGYEGVGETVKLSLPTTAVGGQSALRLCEYGFCVSTVTKMPAKP